MNNLKDTITNILAVIVALGTVIATAIGSVPADAKWYIWVGAAVIAVLGWLMGKNPDGSKKVNPTKV